MRKGLSHPSKRPRTRAPHPYGTPARPSAHWIPIPEVGNKEGQQLPGIPNHGSQLTCCEKARRASAVSVTTRGGTANEEAGLVQQRQKPNERQA